MSLSTVAVTSMLLVGLIFAGGILLEGITFNLDRLINGFGNFNEIISGTARITVENVTVSAGDAILQIEVLNEGQREVNQVYVLVDGKLVWDQELKIFPYEKTTIKVPLEKTNMRRGSRIKVISEGFAAYAVYP